MSIKQELEKQLQARLQEWKADIDKAEAEAKSEKAKAEADKAEADIQKTIWSNLDGLRKKIKTAEQQLTRLKDSTEEEATRIKDEVTRLVA
jgi:hypothetical protein